MIKKQISTINESEQDAVMFLREGSKSTSDSLKNECSYFQLFHTFILILILYFVVPENTKDIALASSEIAVLQKQIFTKLAAQSRTLDWMWKSLSTDTHVNITGDLINTGLSRKESLAWFDVPDKEWMYMKHLHWETRKTQVQVKRLWSDKNKYHNFNWRPSFSCPVNPLRIGYGDGGKVICDPRTFQSEDCLAISIGSRGNFEFENLILSMNPHCEIHTFDCTWDGEAPKNIHYHPWCLGSKDDDHGKLGVMKTLPTILKKLNLMNRDIHIFKIDCEGCEYDIYENFYADGVNIRQIEIEMHTHRGRGHIQEVFEGMMEDLHKNGFVMFSKEPNTYGCPRGECVEYSWMRFNPEFFH